MMDGCWFCLQDNGKMYYTSEWDAYFHGDCLRDRLIENPDDFEADLMNREYDGYFGKITNMGG